MSGIFYSQTKYNYGLDVRGGIRLTYQMELKPEEKTRAAELRSRLIKVLTQRASGSMGVAEPAIIGKGDDQIVVELPDEKNLTRARSVIGTSAKIQFFHAKNLTTEKSQYRPYTTAGTGEKDEDPVVSFERTTGGGKPIEYKLPDGKPNPEYEKIIKGWGDPILEGEDLQNAEMSPRGADFEPLMHFSPSGASKMEAWSRKFYNQRENLAAVLDGKVLSVAAVTEGQVLKDNAIINGKFPNAWVKNLVDLLNGGSLPVTLTELSYERLDPTIGSFALTKIVSAGLVAFAVMGVFLLAYYSFPGLVALFALSLYVLFTLTVLKLMHATFSLAAIAGFVLSVGMAVDANILVFERLKEELKSGKSLMTAIDLGFKRAFPAILDSNACTILTSLVLLALGTGPVKGFATTLIVGVLISLFTAVTVTRSLLVFFAGSGFATNIKWYAVKRSWFGEKFEDRAVENPLKVVESSKIWFAISIVSMVIAIPFFFMGGFKPNVEFQGGYELVYPVATTMTADAMTANLEKAGYKGSNVKIGQLGNGEQRIYITIPPNDQFDKDAKVPELVGSAAGLTGVDYTNVSPSQVGPLVQAETIRNAILSVVISAGMIVLYLAFRFGFGSGGFKAGLRFGGSAVIALLHDVLVVAGTSAIFGFLFKWEVSALFLTAMLTVIGFSVHDTIVIFDRIRENLHRQRQPEDFGHLVDRSISQSFARSINTSATVVVTLAILLAVGAATPDLKFFVLAMLVGIVSGTYSSIFNASPILYLWNRAATKKNPANSLVAMAIKDHAQQRIMGTVAAMPTTPTGADAPVTGSDGRTYGQVKRRASAPKQGHIEIEED